MACVTQGVFFIACVTRPLPSSPFLRWRRVKFYSTHHFVTTVTTHAKACINPGKFTSRDLLHHSIFSITAPMSSRHSQSCLFNIFLANIL